MVPKLSPLPWLSTMLIWMMKLAIYVLLPIRLVQGPVQVLYLMLSEVWNIYYRKEIKTIFFSFFVHRFQNKHKLLPVFKIQEENKVKGFIYDRKTQRYIIDHILCLIMM